MDLEFLTRFKNLFPKSYRTVWVEQMKQILFIAIIDIIGSSFAYVIGSNLWGVGIAFLALLVIMVLFISISVILLTICTKLITPIVPEKYKLQSLVESKPEMGYLLTVSLFTILWSYLVYVAFTFSKDAKVIVTISETPVHIGIQNILFVLLAFMVPLLIQMWYKQYKISDVELDAIERFR